jgi:hypothetical protein
MHPWEVLCLWIIAVKPLLDEYICVCASLCC